MKTPLSIRPAFIGDLIKLEAGHDRSTPAWHLLCQAVQQCRNFNSAETQEERERLWSYMVATQQHLARLGVVVG
jgi:hypothetical protein